MARIFLLSPARLDGLRAKQLTSPRAKFAAALQYRTDEGVPIADAFAFMSALYFRGKIAYARQFATPPAGQEHSIFVITSGYGLVPPDWRLNAERIKRMRKVGLDVDSRSYVQPLREHATGLLANLREQDDVVLLGSVATGKYVDVLWPIFGSRLKFPSAFAGLGDMARGGLMLRAARSGNELAYVTLDANRKRPPGASGKMPAIED